MDESKRPKGKQLGNVFTLAQVGAKTWIDVARRIHLDIASMTSALCSCSNKTRLSVAQVLFIRIRKEKGAKEARRRVGVAVRRSGVDIFVCSGVPTTDASVNFEYIDTFTPEYQGFLLDNGANHFQRLIRTDSPRFHQALTSLIEEIVVIAATAPTWNHRDVFEALPFPIRNKFPLIAMVLNHVNRERRGPSDHTVFDHHVRTKILSYFVVGELEIMLLKEGHHEPKGPLVLPFVTWLDTLLPSHRQMALHWHYYRGDALLQILFPGRVFIEHNLSLSSSSTHALFQSHSKVIFYALNIFPDPMLTLRFLSGIAGPDTGIYDVLSILYETRGSRKLDTIHPKIERVIRACYATSTMEQRKRLDRSGALVGIGMQRLPLLCGPNVEGVRYAISPEMLVQWKRDWFRWGCNHALCRLKGTFEYQVQIGAVALVLSYVHRHRRISPDEKTFQAKEKYNRFIILKRIDGYLSQHYGILYGGEDQKWLEIKGPENTETP